MPGRQRRIRVAYCIFSSSSASSSSVDRSSSSSFSFCVARAHCQPSVLPYSHRIKLGTYILNSHALLQGQLALVQAAELVDLVLVLSPDLYLVASLLFGFRELHPSVSAVAVEENK